MWQISPLFFFLQNFSIFGQFFFLLNGYWGHNFFGLSNSENLPKKKSTDSKGLFNEEKMALFARF
jgi:hypothetical protein